MSAYICNPEQFALLAVYAHLQGISEEDPQDLAEEMVKENIASVAYRYPFDVSGNRPGPQMHDADIVTAAKLWVKHYLLDYPKVTKSIIKTAVENLDYQCNERDEYNKSPTKELLDKIELHLGNASPSTGWQFTDDTVLPGIESLYL